MKNKKLYFHHIGGAGIFICLDCGHSQELVSFLHGFGRRSWNKTSYQCQLCGRFVEIEYDHTNKAGRKCECGGTLSRDEPLFCPVCHSFNVYYHMSVIT